MRTTLDIHASVLEELRRRSKRGHRSMGPVASELLASAIAEGGRHDTPPTFRWNTADLGVPRLDLEDKEGVRRVLDQR
jgi:hypothetical protein